MTINEFAKLYTKVEGKHNEANFGQAKETLSVINKLFGGRFYQSIKNLSVEAAEKNLVKKTSKKKANEENLS